MQSEFMSAVEALKDANERFQKREVSSYDHKHLRESALSSALKALAEANGVTLQLPVQIDSRGDFSIVAAAIDGEHPSAGCSGYGEKFSGILNNYSPRTGVMPGATLTAKSGWCYMNHFEVEKMVVEQSQYYLLI